MYQWLLNVVDSKSKPYCHHQVTLFNELQLQPEHIFDLEHCDIAVFIDCQIQNQKKSNFAVQWKCIQPARQLSHSTHIMSIENLLYLFESCLGKPAPTCYFLSIQGNQFGLGSAPSKLLIENMNRAKSLLAEKISQLETSPRLPPPPTVCQSTLAGQCDNPEHNPP